MHSSNGLSTLYSDMQCTAVCLVVCQQCYLPCNCTCMPFHALTAVSGRGTAPCTNSLVATVSQMLVP